MIPLQHDLSYYRGGTDVASIQWTDDSGTAINLAGYSATMTIRRHDGTLVDSTSGAITATITAATGTIVFTITDAGAAALPVGVHVYDVFVVSSGGIDYPLLTGNFLVRDEVRS